MLGRDWAGIMLREGLGKQIWGRTIPKEGRSKTKLGGYQDKVIPEENRPFSKGTFCIWQKLWSWGGEINKWQQRYRKAWSWSRWNQNTKGWGRGWRLSTAGAFCALAAIQGITFFWDTFQNRFFMENENSFSPGMAGGRLGGRISHWQREPGIRGTSNFLHRGRMLSKAYSGPLGARQSVRWGHYDTQRAKRAVWYQT